MRNRVDMICDANNFAEAISMAGNRILEIYESMAELYPVYQESLEEWKDTMFNLDIQRNYTYNDYGDLSDEELDEKCKEYVGILKTLENKVEDLDKKLDKLG